MSNFVGKRPNPLAAAIQGAAKLFGKKQKTTGREVIDKIKPGTKFEGIPKYQKDIIKVRSEVQKKFQPINEGIKKETTQLRQKLQGMRGERITQSGISKGKDVTPGIYKPLKDKKKQDLAKGGRVGLKGGSDLGMQSVKYDLDNKPEITKLDRIAKFIAKDKKKKNKKFKSPIAKAIKKNKKKII
jgi:hypothetical protein